MIRDESRGYHCGGQDSPPSQQKRRLFVCFLLPQAELQRSMNNIFVFVCVADAKRSRGVPDCKVCLFVFIRF
jgi:hypothetical protein